MKRVAIVGSRDYPNARIAAGAVLSRWAARTYDPQHQVTIVSGGARGVDSVAIEIAKARGFPVQVLPADWQRWGKRAGYMRNEELVSVVDEVIVLWDGESKGSKHTIDLTLRLRKHLEVIFP